MAIYLCDGKDEKRENWEINNWRKQSEKRLAQRKQDTTNKNKYEQLLGTVLLKILHFLSEFKMLKRTRG